MAKRRRPNDTPPGKKPALSLEEIKRTIDEDLKLTNQQRTQMTRYLDRYKNVFWPHDRKSAPIAVERDTIESGITVNFAFANVSQIAPLLMDQRPLWQVRARSRVEQPYINEWNKALEWLWSIMKMSMVSLKLAYSALVMGLGVAHVSWNPDDPQGGMVSVRVVDPRHFVFPNGYDDIDECPWVAEVCKKPVSWVRSNFPETGKDVVGEHVKDANLRGEDMTAWSMNSQMVKVYQIWMRDPTTEEVIVEKQRQNSDGRDAGAQRIKKAKYPNGRFLTFAEQASERGGHVLLEDVPSPYGHGKSPYVLYYDYIVPHQIYGQGELDQVCDLLDELNRMVRDVAYQLHVQARTNYLVQPDEVANIDSVEENWHKGGQFFHMSKPLDKDRRAPIAPVEVPLLAREQIDFLSLLKTWLEEITGVTELSKGVQTKRAEQSASEIETLAESTHTRTRQRVRNSEYCMEQILERILLVAMQFTDERDYSVVRDEFIGHSTIGNSRDFALQALRDFHAQERQMMAQDAAASPQEQQQQAEQQERDDMAFAKLFPVGDQDNIAQAVFQIVIQSNSMLPLDQQARASLAMRLFQSNGIDVQTLLETLQFPDPQKVVARLQEQEAAAQQPPMDPNMQPPVA